MLSVIRDRHPVIYQLVKSVRGPKLQGTPVAWVNCASFYREDFDKFNGNIELTWKPIKGLTLRAIGGYNYALSTIRNYRADMPLAGGQSTGPSSLTNSMGAYCI